MAKNNADVKSLKQGDAEKSRGSRTQLDLEELTAELHSIKKETTSLKEDIQRLKTNKDNDPKRENEDMQSLELKLEQEKHTRTRMDSTIYELQQKILKLEAEKGQVSDEIGSATFQAKVVVTKVEKEMLLLKAQNESLSKKHKELEHILSAKESLLKGKSSEVTEKNHKSVVQEVEKLGAICNELKLQIKVWEDIQEGQGEKQAERDTIGFKYVKKVGGKESKLKLAKLNKLTEIQQEIQETADVVKQQLESDEKELKNKIWREEAMAFKTAIQRFQTKGEFCKINDLNQRRQHLIDSQFLNHMRIQDVVSFWYHILKLMDTRSVAMKF